MSGVRTIAPNCIASIARPSSIETLSPRVTLRRQAATAAAEWRAAWRRAVPDGVVAVLDAASDRAVVRWGPGGTVADVGDRG